MDFDVEDLISHKLRRLFPLLAEIKKTSLDFFSIRMTRPVSFFRMVPIVLELYRRKWQGGKINTFRTLLTAVIVKYTTEKTTHLLYL